MAQRSNRFAAAPLFAADVPDGFHHRPEFVSVEAEAALVDRLGAVEFSTFEMRGVVARRRVAFFGRSYDAGASAPPPIPDFLAPLRGQLAAWAGVDAAAFAMALINEYTPGAPIGWHRDAPQYGIVAGLSLLSSCRMRFRPYVGPHAHAASSLRAPMAAALRPGSAGERRTATHEIVLAPRSAYLLTGDARQSYEHSIPAVASLRYSITFRTLRA
jgi:alkylated DNA repair dioxygenase AlkB